MLDSGTIEESLFGNAQADNVTQGYLEQALGGTLVIDDVSALDLNSQARLVAVLETGSFTKTSDKSLIPADFRLCSRLRRVQRIFWPAKKCVRIFLVARAPPPLRSLPCALTEKIFLTS